MLCCGGGEGLLEGADGVGVLRVEGVLLGVGRFLRIFSIRFITDKPSFRTCAAWSTSNDVCEEVSK